MRNFIKNSKYRDLTKNTLLFTLSNFGTKIISFLLVPLYTYVLSTSDYGTADLMTTTVSLLLPVFTFNIQDAVLRFCLDKEYYSEQVISVSVKTISINTCFLGILLYLLKFLGVLAIEDKYLAFLFISFAAAAFFNSIQMYLKATERVEVIVVSSLLTTVLNCILNMLLLLYLKIGVNGYLIAQAVSSLAGVAYCVLRTSIIHTLKIRFDFVLLKTMLLYSTPLIFNSLAWWLNNASDRYILSYFCGAGSNGIYSVSYKIPTILSTLQGVFYNAWSVSAIKEFDSQDKDGFVGNIYHLYCGISILGCSVILLFNNVIAGILYSNDFYKAWKYVPLLMIGTVFNGISLFEGCLYTAVKRTKSVSKTTMAGALVNTCLNFLLIPVWGTMGAAFATFVGYFVVWLVRTLDLRNIIMMKVKWSKQIISIILLILQCFLASLGRYAFIQAAILIVLCQIQYSLIRKGNPQ